MDIAISVTDVPDVDAELRHLYRWLCREEDLPSSALTISPRSPGPENMGTVTDVLVVALGSGGFGAILANTLNVWLQNRRSDLTVKFSGPGGTYELQATRVKNPDEIVETLRKAAG